MHHRTPTAALSVSVSATASSIFVTPLWEIALVAGAAVLLGAALVSFLAANTISAG